MSSELLGVLGVAVVLAALAVGPVGPTPRTALAVGALAVSAILLPVGLVALGGVGLATAAVVDALAARRTPASRRELPRLLARGVPAPLLVTASGPRGASVRIRQPRVPDVSVEPAEADTRLEARTVARRRGRHVLPPVALRVTGPLGLAAWRREAAGPAEVLVYPDLPAARRLVASVRTNRFGDPGNLRRGPLGLGTEFESIREYSPDDDVRQVNWRATARIGHPMSNQWRVEQDRDVVAVVDCGRLMAAPLGDRTRLDTAVDVVAAVALVADEVGDRCGVVAFDDGVRRRLPPRRRGGEAVVQAVFDLEPRRVDADYELAFRTVGRGKRAFVLVLTDLLEEAAAGPLLDAVPVLARRHAVTVASVADPDLERAVRTPPSTTDDVYTAVAALDVLESRRRVAAHLRRTGAEVVEAGPDRLAAACVDAYLRAKTRAQL